MIAAALERVSPGLPADTWAMELGCGPGGALGALRESLPSGRIVAFDMLLPALEHARARRPNHLVLGDAGQLPFRGRPFGLVCAFDVIEHLADDVGMLREIAERLVGPGGLVCVTVPAGPELWSYFDEEARHRRRYSRAQLVERLEAAGFAVEYATHFMMPLVPLVWLARRSRRPAEAERLPAARELRVVPVLNGVAAAALAIEAALIRRRLSLAWGTSLLAIARLRKA